MIVNQVTWGDASAYRELQHLSSATLRLALPGANYSHVHFSGRNPLAKFGKLLCDYPRVLVVDVDLVALSSWDASELNLKPDAPFAGVKARFKERVARSFATKDQLRRFLNGGLVSYGEKHHALLARAIAIGCEIHSTWFEETALNLALLEQEEEPLFFPATYNVQASFPSPHEKSFHCNLIRDPRQKLEACRDALRRFACPEFRKALERQKLL